MYKTTDISFHCDFAVWLFYFIFFRASLLLEAGGEVAETQSAGQEVQTPSLIPLNWNPSSSGVATSKRSVCTCVCGYHEDWVGAALTCNASKQSEIPAGVSEQILVRRDVTLSSLAQLFTCK